MAVQTDDDCGRSQTVYTGITARTPPF